MFFESTTPTASEPLMSELLFASIERALLSAGIHFALGNLSAAYETLAVQYRLFEANADRRKFSTLPINTSSKDYIDDLKKKNTDELEEEEEQADEDQFPTLGMVGKMTLSKRGDKNFNDEDSDHEDHDEKEEEGFLGQDDNSTIVGSLDDSDNENDIEEKIFDISFKALVSI